MKGTGKTMGDDYRAQLDRSYEADRLASKHIKRMMPKHRMRLARAILQELIDGGHITYANFQSAQAAEKYIKRAAKNLEGLN